MHFGNVAPSAFRSAGLPLTGLDELAGVAISGVLGDQQAVWIMISILYTACQACLVYD
jgi:hypothetical protein